MLLAQLEIEEKVNKLLRDYFKAPLSIRVGRQNLDNVQINITPASLHSIEYTNYKNNFDNPKITDILPLSISTTCKCRYPSKQTEGAEIEEFGYIENLSIKIDRQGNISLLYPIHHIETKTAI